MNVTGKQFICSLVVASLYMVGTAANAGSHTWSGASDGNWSNPANWVAGGPPANGESVTLVFPASQGNMGTMHNDLTGLTVTSMTFGDTAYIVAGNPFNLAGKVAVTGGTSYSAARIDANVTLTADSTFESTNVVSDISSAAYNLLVFGTISGAMGVGIHIGCAGGGNGGEVRLEQANSYNGPTWVDKCYLFADHPAALGGSAYGVFVATGATFAINGGYPDQWTISGKSLTVGGGGANGNSALQFFSTNWTGPVTLTNETTMLSSGPTRLSGPVSGNFGLNLRGWLYNGIGELTFTNDNTYSQPTTIESGTLVVNGSQPASDVLILGYSTPPSTLRGSGRVGNVSAGNGTVSAKIVAPGTTAATGVLHTGNFSLADAANGDMGVLSLRLNGTVPGSTYDQVAASGTVDVSNANLALSLGFRPAIGNSFVIVSNDGTDPVTGVFKLNGVAIPEGARFVLDGVPFKISYAGGTNGNDIVLRVVGKAKLAPINLLLLD